MEARYSGEVGESNGKRNGTCFIDSPLFTDLRQTRTVYKHTYYKLSKIELLYIRVFPTLYSNHLYRLLLGFDATVKRYNTLFQMKQGIVSKMP